MKVAVVVVVLALCPGCSWIFVHRHDPTAEGRPECTSAHVPVPVVVDAAVIALSIGAVVLIDSSTPGPMTTPSVLVQMFGIPSLSIIALAEAASAISGLVWSSTCREAIATYDKDDWSSKPASVSRLARPAAMP